MRLPMPTVRALSAVVNVLICMVAIALLLGPGLVEAKGATPGVGRGLIGNGRPSRQPMGPIHEFKKDTRLERWTNRPKTDKQHGLRPHAFWTKPDRGPKGRAPHLRKEFNIDHPLKQREEMIARRGTRYHERPVRGGKDHAREVIIHDRVPKRDVRLQERVRK